MSVIAAPLGAVTTSSKSLLVTSVHCGSLSNVTHSSQLHWGSVVVVVLTVAVLVVVVVQVKVEVDTVGVVVWVVVVVGVVVGVVWSQEAQQLSAKSAFGDVGGGGGGAAVGAATFTGW